MKAALALGKFWRSLAFVFLLTVSVACGSSNNNNPNPTPTPDPTATAPGDYAVTRFVLTNIADSSDVVDGDSVGLSIYFILNEDGSLSGTAQIPNDPPEKTQFTGNWDLDTGTLTIEFVEDEGSSRTLTGTLSFDADGDVVFLGSQTAGTPVELGSSGQQYNITTFEMIKIEPDVTNAIIAGEWIAVKGTDFSNLDPEIQENLLENGAGVRVVFEENGTVTIFNTLAGGGEDNFATTYELVDNFNMTMLIESINTPIVYFLIDDSLTIFLYSDIERDFDNDNMSVDVPATRVIVFEKS